MDADNTLETCWEVTTRTLHETFAELYDAAIDLEGILLKPNMVIAGKGCPEQASAERVAQATVDCFRAVVPAAVPGIVFLSGGQIGGTGDREPERDQPDRRAVAAVLLVRARAPGLGARGWGGDPPTPSSAGGVRASRAHERARRGGRVERRAGAAGRGLVSSRFAPPRGHRARSARGAPSRRPESAPAERGAPLGASRGRGSLARAGRQQTGRLRGALAPAARAELLHDRLRGTRVERRGRAGAAGRRPGAPPLPIGRLLSRARRAWRRSTGCATSCSASSPRSRSRSRAGDTRSSAARSSRSSR